MRILFMVKSRKRLQKLNLCIKFCIYNSIILGSLQLQMALSKGLITSMISKTKGDKENFIIQCRNLSKHKQFYVVFQLFDGQQKCKGVAEIQRAKKSFDPYLKNNRSCKIIVHSFEVHNVKKNQNIMKVIQVKDFKIMKDVSVKKEHCFNQALPKQEEVVYKNKKDQSFKSLVKLQSVKCETIQRPYMKNNTITKSNVNPRPLLRLDSQQSDNEETLTTVTKDVNIRSFQNIEDLYEGLYGWQLLVRVIEKSFRQFVSKQNRQITILTIEFIDRSGSMIQATCFGQHASYLNTVVKVGGVYRVSRGRICEETYSSQKTNKHSKYTIKIVRDTSIIPMRDFTEIPYNSNNFLRLSQISDGINSSHFFNFIGILVKVEEEKTISKQNKQITMQMFKIGDPITSLVFDCIIWNKQIQIPVDLMNKSVLLKKFKVNKYKGAVNLCATFRSQMVTHDHFLAYEDIWKPQLSVKQAQKSAKTLNQLSNELNYIEKEPILSEVNVWTNAICLGSKWYYDSCPKCKKTATAYNNCENCSYPIQQCKKRFLLTVELCDYTGSLYVTAFEDTATIFLRNMTIQQLLALDESKRKAIGDSFTFQSYNMKISSKKDSNGRISHQILGKPQPLDMKVQAQMNLQSIQRQLRKKYSIFDELQNDQF